jgi:hypothetical protein
MKQEIAFFQKSELEFIRVDRVDKVNHHYLDLVNISLFSCIHNKPGFVIGLSPDQAKRLAVALKVAAETIPSGCTPTVITTRVNPNPPSTKAAPKKPAAGRKVPKRKPAKVSTVNSETQEQTT